jgi:small subunit ribosomal protein S17
MASKKTQPKPVVSAGCTDPHCPIHAGFSTRGSVKRGFVASKKLAQMAVVEIPMLTRSKKYERFAKKRSRIHAHVPACIKTETGDIVEIAECRKISKTKAFVIMRVVQSHPK